MTDRHDTMDAEIACLHVRMEREEQATYDHEKRIRALERASFIIGALALAGGAIGSSVGAKILTKLAVWGG